jgi:hypothetical protein
VSTDPFGITWVFALNKALIFMGNSWYNASKSSLFPDLPLFTERKEGSFILDGEGCLERTI